MGNIKELFAQWFKSNEGSKGEPVREQIKEHPKVQSKERLSPPDASRKPVTLAQVSKKTLTISEKLAALKEALEFDENAKVRLDEIHSHRDLLLYIHEVLLFRFLRFREIGLLSPESSKAIDVLNQRFETVLMKPEPSSGPGEGKACNDAVLKENEALKKQIDSLREKHLKQGIISEKELQLEEETDYLKRRLRELNSRLEITNKKADAFTAAQEMIKGLRAKNSLLNSKIEHQSGLLRSLAKDNTKHQEYISSMERLRDENGQLKSRLEQQSGVLDQLHQFMPTDSSSQGLVKDLMKTHKGLLAELDERSSRLEVMASKDPDKNVSESLERLHDENIYIKNLIEANQSIDSFVKGGKAGKEDPERMIELLGTENQRLEQLLTSKKEQIKVLASAPSNRGLMKVLRRLKEENTQLVRENGFKQAFCVQLERERQLLQTELRRVTPQIQDLRQIKTELEFNKRLVESLKKIQFNYDALKKKYAELNSKYDVDVQKNILMSEKLEKLSAEHNLLLQEYENLFGGELK